MTTRFLSDGFKSQQKSKHRFYEEILFFCTLKTIQEKKKTQQNNAITINKLSNRINRKLHSIVNYDLNISFLHALHFTK